MLDTHWHQTIVFLGGVFAPVPEGELIDYSIEMVQSEENPRWYEISLVT